MMTIPMFRYCNLLFIVMLSLACASEFRGSDEEYGSNSAAWEGSDADIFTDKSITQDEAPGGEDHALLGANDDDAALAALEQSSSLIIASFDDAESAEEEALMKDDETLLDDRSLLVQYPVPCNGQIVPFDLKFNLQTQGGWSTWGCTSTKKTQLALAINSLLLDYGVGQAGQYDAVKFHAEVCTTPKTLNRRRLGCNCSFLYGGPMNCGYCGPDNNDRALREGENDGARQLTTGDPNWFVNIYAPEMQNTLRNAFVSRVQQNHKECLGNGPMVDIQITPRSTIKTTPC